jgi:hypothetical protein
LYPAAWQAFGLATADDPNSGQDGSSEQTSREDQLFRFELELAEN